MVRRSAYVPPGRLSIGIIKRRHSAANAITPNRANLFGDIQNFLSFENLDLPCVQNGAYRLAGRISEFGEASGVPWFWRRVSKAKPKVE